MKKLEVRKLETLKPTAASYSVYINLAGIRLAIDLSFLGGQATN